MMIHFMNLLTSQGSSSNMRPIHTPFESLGRWTKDHPIANEIRDPSCSVSTRKQLQTNDMWCYFDAFLTSVEPKNFKQAMTEPSWIDAMQEEIHEFERLQVKTDEFGGVLKNKARLVAQGFRQEEGIDFEESFTPDNPSHVYKLKKALYGLKQAPCAWYDMLSSFFISQHFSKGAMDPTLFTRKAGNDLLLFKMSMMGQMSFFLGLKISQSSRVYLCTRYQAKPTEKHLNAVKRIFRYLKESINMGLWYSKDTGMSLTAYADANHARCQDTRHNTSGSAQFLEYQLADISTKPLPRERFNFLIEKLAQPVLSIFHRIMSSITAQQAKLNLELVPKEKRLEIGKCNRRINPGKTQREPTFQVVLDALAVTPCYSAFLTTADVPEICPRVHGQDFDEFPLMKLLCLSSKNLVILGKSSQSAMLLWIRCINLGELLLLSSTEVYLKRHPVLTSFVFLELKSFGEFSPEEPTRKTKRVKRPTKKSTNTPTTGVIIRDTPVMSLSKKKEKMTIEKHKGIDFLSEVALTEEAQYEEFCKKCLMDFHKTHSSGSGIVTSAAKIKPSVTNKK
ncbi:retrovirus-related pol polyprotein from transposon TNT 1-94 [Tanacetum coccineum]|uniref:Retrovirus-related pol polyprotein from transposon TNT 1-94 n=1 Tax=Tanacetum coccineum TaxID=301880 RepID=A0ABQ5I1F9_9ASTR